MVMLIGIALNVYVVLDGMVFSIIVILLINEHRLSFHFLLSFYL